MANCCYPSNCGDMPTPTPRPMRIQYVGEPKLCSILCAQEVDNPSPTYPIRSRRTRHIFANPDRMSVGILQSLVASNDKALYFDDREMNGQRYAMCLKAFAFLHIMPVYKWTRKILDNLLQEGAELYSAGPEDEKTGEPATTSNYQRHIYTSNEQVIRRVFKLEGYEFEVDLGEKFVPGPKGNEVDHSSTDVNIDGLRSALNGFFKKHNYCLLSTTNLYLFLWHSNGVYFLMDFYGRDSELDLSREGGFATLICMREVRNVEYLVTQKSGLGKKDIFTLRELRLLMLVDPEGRAMMRYFTAHRADEFVQVTDEYAYLKSKLHLSLREKDPLISRCGLPVGVAAIIASKIDHPASWDTRNLNKIVCYGFYICQCCWQYCQHHAPIDFDSFPNQLQIGQFAVNLTILARIAHGKWRCVPQYQATELTVAIDNCWNNGHDHLLLSIHQQTYSIWRKNGYYYFFDPYRHRLPKSETQSASLRMFSSKEILFHVLHLVLMQSNPKTVFYIHRVVVTDIRASIGIECLPPMPRSPCSEDLVEAKSINEGICFREDFKHCWKELGQISEDEEEDSVVEEIFVESEEEIVMGEEEGRLGGDMEGVESSDEDRLWRKQKPSRKGARKGSPKLSKSKTGKGKSGIVRRGSLVEGKSRGKKDKGKGGHKKGKSAKEGGDSGVERFGDSKSKELHASVVKSKESNKQGAKKDQKEKGDGDKSEFRKEEKIKVGGDKTDSKKDKSDIKKDGKEKKDADKTDSKKDEKADVGKGDSKKNQTYKADGDRGDSKKNETVKRDGDKGKKDEKAKADVDKGDTKKDGNAKAEADKGDSKKNETVKADSDKGKKDEKAKADVDKGDTKKDGNVKAEADKGDSKKNETVKTDGDKGKKDEKAKADVEKGDTKKDEKVKADAAKGDSKKDEKAKAGADKDIKDEKGDIMKDEKAKADAAKADSKKDEKAITVGDKGKKDEKAKADVDKGDSKKDEKTKVDSDKGGSRKDEKAKADVNTTDIKNDKKAKTDADKRDSKKHLKSKVEGERGDDRNEAKERTGVGKDEIRKDEKSDSQKSERREKGEKRLSDGGRYRPDNKILTKDKKGKYDDEKSKDDSGLSTAFSHQQFVEDEGRLTRRYSDRFVDDIHRDLMEEESQDRLEGTVCRPNAYPGFSSIPFNLGVAGSENGSYESICKLLRAGFKYADRVLTMTPFGNFVVFRGHSPLKKTYFVFDGCTCNVERFRHLDITCGTAGLLCFNSLHNAITYIIDSRHIRKCIKKNRKQLVDEICSRYCK